MRWFLVLLILLASFVASSTIEDDETDQLDDGRSFNECFLSTNKLSLQASRQLGSLVAMIIITITSITG